MSDQNPIKVHIEGWRRINHSYALVNRHQLRWMLRDARLSITHREMPYFKSHWQANPIGSFPAVFEEALTLPDQDAPSDVDITLRMDFPHRFDMPAKGKLVVFGTTEYTQISPENLRGDVAGAAANPKVFILTPSQWSAKGFLKLGFPQERIWVLPHGVDREHFRPTSPEEKLKYRAQLGIDPHAQVFLHVGGGWFGKGLDILIEAFSIHAKTHPNSRLVIKGHDALYGNAVRNAFANRPLALPAGVELATEQILYLGGDLNDQAMDQLYRLSDCYVATYRGEGFNMPLLEAAARGIATIATQGGSSDDFLPTFRQVTFIPAKRGTMPHGDEFLAPSREALVTSLESQAMLKGWSNHQEIAKQTLDLGSKRFSWEAVSQNLVESIVKLAKNSDITEGHIVFVQIGSQRLRPHFFDAVNQAIREDPKATVWLILEQEQIELATKHFKDYLECKLKIVSTKTLEQHPFHQFFQQSSQLPHAHGGFWRYTTERFFYLLRLAQQFALKNIVHLESDVLIYSSVTQLIASRRGNHNILFPLDKSRGFGSIIFFTDKDAIGKLCLHILASPPANDMDLLGSFFLKHRNDDVGNLPTVPEALAIESGLELTRYCRPTNEKWGLFDGAFLGQYLGGVDPIHDRRVLAGFVNEQAPVHPAQIAPTWEYRERKPFPVSDIYSDYPINNLHIHSKLTHYFVNGKDQELPEEKDIITGDRVVGCCDLVITTHAKAKFHRSELVRSVPTLFIDEHHKPGTTIIDAEFFRIADQYRVLFVYGDMLDFFTAHIAPFLESEHVVVIHNSDVEFDHRYVKILNNKAIVKIFAQNLTTSHSKIIGIPIGLANEMWPHGDLREYCENRQARKLKRSIYIGYLEPTHQQRLRLQMTIKSIGLQVSDKRLNYRDYVKQMSHHHLVFAPRGNGIDTHRLWEAIYCGSVPLITKEEVHNAILLNQPEIQLDWKSSIEAVTRGIIPLITCRLFTVHGLLQEIRT
jgi:glycosyltransferase involved in cell wall biosynthesis